LIIRLQPEHLLGEMLLLQDNVSLSSMGTGTLLDILNRPSNDTNAAANKTEETATDIAQSSAKSGVQGGLKSVLEGLEEMWDDSQYAEEFSLDSFVKKLR
jgi:TATA-binding protein-associated factor